MRPAELRREGPAAPRHRMPAILATARRTAAIRLLALAALATAGPTPAAHRLYADGFERTVTTGCVGGTPAVPAGLVLQSPFADPSEIEVRTRGIWAIWWQPEFDHAADAEIIFDRLETVRCNALQFLRMRDPPNPARGRYYNVYIHHGTDDAFPDEWGNGQGTDAEDNPFLTLPAGFLLDTANLDHEGFHVFQYASDSPGFAYAGDGAWFTEASAQWYMSTQAPQADTTFVQIGTIDANPQLALWHGWTNTAPGDPDDWNYGVRQYGMHSFLHYLTVVADVSHRVITDGFYGGVTQLPQEYLVARVGAAALRRIFVDWAAANTADFDYLTPQQVTRARQESQTYGNPATMNPYVAELGADGTAGAWSRPPDGLAPRGWAYNVIRLGGPSATTYVLQIEGDAAGSEGATSLFDARVVILRPSGPEYTALEMLDAQWGLVSVPVPADASELFLVVAAMPAHFTGNQTYGYRYRIVVDPP
jgi:hypothetical protein